MSSASSHSAAHAAHTSHHHEAHHDDGSLKVFGFWIYILQDLFLFATLFATVAVFSSSYDYGKSGKELIDLNFVLVETFVLLFSSITYGFAMVAMHRNDLKNVNLWLGFTFVFGAIFIAMELYEFNHLLHEVPFYSATAFSHLDPVTMEPVLGKKILSAYWSSFFLLVGTHGLHVSAGLIWMGTMFFHLRKNGLTAHNKTRLTCLSIFWHFLDIVWIGVFTIVYLLGAL